MRFAGDGEANWRRVASTHSLKVWTFSAPASLMQTRPRGGVVLGPHDSTAAYSGPSRQDLASADDVPVHKQFSWQLFGFGHASLPP